MNMVHFHVVYYAVWLFLKINDAPVCVPVGEPLHV